MSKSITDRMQEKFNNFWRDFVAALDQYDAQSWPAFFTFFTVISLGMILNFFGFRPVVGDLAAFVISCLFEVAILAWKMTTSRKRNDDAQNQLAGWAVWLSVALAVSMLIVNLFRVGGDSHFETTAYAIVGLAAIVQVVFYLLFDQMDPDKKIKREHAQSKRDIDRKRTNAKNVIDEVEADMGIVRLIRDRLNELQTKNSDLPTPQLEYLLETARKKLLSEYAGGKDAELATRGMADVNKDGMVGNRPIKGNNNGYKPTAPEPEVQKNSF